MSASQYRVTILLSIVMGKHCSVFFIGMIVLDKKTSVVKELFTIFNFKNKKEIKLFSLMENKYDKF